MRYPSLAAFPILDTLRLIRSENVGPVTFFQLIQRFGSPGNALEAIPELSLKGGRAKPITVCSKADAARELEETERFGAQFLPYGSALYPALLHEIYDPPPLLALRGRSDLWPEARRMIAIVGARNASANGCVLAEKLALGLGEQAITVVSGLARGVDTAAHKGALKSGTVGVIACGINLVYPPENAKFYDSLAAEGAILSEQPLSAPPQSRSFPGRNRIISGMCQGVIVIEASLQSGSLITARYAAEHGREVFAVPGSPLDPRARGGNLLLKEGATLVESIEDVLQHLQTMPQQLREGAPSGFEAAPTAPTDEHTLTRWRPKVLEKLGPEPQPIDALLAQLEAPPTALYTILLELELAGRLWRGPGNMVALLYNA